MLNEPKPNLAMPLEGLGGMVAMQPEPKRVLGPLKQGTWGIIAAPPGVGKSMLTLGWALAISRRSSWCHWEKPDAPMGIFMIDAEMSARAIHGRALSMGPYAQWENVAFNCQELHDRASSPPFILNSAGWQAWLMERACNHRVVIIDNVSFTLQAERPGEIYSPETWNQVIPLLNWARQEAKCLIFVDHTNKEGQIAGSIHKQRGADFLMLMEADEKQGNEKLAFILKISKYRDELAKEYEQAQRVSAWVPPGQNSLDWMAEPVLSNREMAREMRQCGATPDDIAQSLGASKRTVYKWLK